MLVWAVLALTLAGAAGADPFTRVLKNGGMTQVGVASPATWALAGWFKTAGAAKTQVFVQAFAAGCKQNQFIQVQYRQGDSD